MIPTLHVDLTIAEALSWGDYVSIGLWNACTRHYDKDTHEIKCTETSISYSFDPASIWTAPNGPTKADITLPVKVLNILDVQSRNTLLIKIFFLASFGLSVLCIVLGGIGVCAGERTRRPAFKQRMLDFTALLSLSTTVSLLAGAGVATRAYHTLLDVMNPSFGDYINFKLGTAGMAMLWVSMLLSLISSSLWIHSWRKEHKYRRQQCVRGKTAWTKVDVQVHVDLVPNGEMNDDKSLLQKDTSYHSPKHI